MLNESMLNEYLHNQKRVTAYAVTLEFLVGARRFELPTPCSRSRCATRLRYAPTELLDIALKHLTCNFFHKVPVALPFWFVTVCGRLRLDRLLAFLLI